MQTCIVICTCDQELALIVADMLLMPATLPKGIFLSETGKREENIIVLRSHLCLATFSRHVGDIGYKSL